MVDNKTSFDMIKSDQVVYLKYVQVLVFQYFLKVVFKKTGFIGPWESLKQSLN